MRRIAIVGSRSLKHSVEARRLVRVTIWDAIQLFKNDLEIISGGAEGVDEMAEAEALLLNIPPARIKIFRPNGVGWPAFKARNDEMAEYCDELHCIADPDSRTKGCLYTATQATKLGKQVTTHWVRSRSARAEEPAADPH